MQQETIRLTVPEDATKDEHFRTIRSVGQQYLAQASRQHLPGPARQRIIQAALDYLQSRTNLNSAPSQSASQSLHASQGGAAASAAASVRDASFQSHLTALIDSDISPHVLIDSCVRATDNDLLNVLVKCLCVLARIGHIRDLKSVDGQLVISQSQYQDHELEPTPLIEGEQPNQPHRLEDSLASVQPNPANTDVTVPRVVVRRTGQNFVDEFVSKLVSGESENATSQTRCCDVFNASVVREVPLSDHAKERVLHLLTNRMRKVDVYELPAFIYQLLLIASKKGKDTAKSRVLLNIAEVFNTHEEKCRETDKLSDSLRGADEDAIVVNTMSVKELRQIQGTALYHIDVAARQDSTLSAEVIRLTKAGVENPRHLLSSFGCGIVLLLARSTLLRNQVLPLLREALVRFDRERASRLDNVFVARVTLNDDVLLNPRESLIKIVESTCESGWDLVNEGLLEFAYVLLDKPLPILRTTRRQSLAKELIVRLFTTHSIMRSSILQQLQSRIALQEKSAYHSIRIIQALTDTVPSVMLEHQTFIRDCIELLVSLPEWLASPLMHCFKPFLELRKDLLDFFYLVVRKSLFYRESATRAVAITGFLTLAKIVKEGAGDKNLSQVMSQVSFSQQSGQMSRVNAIVETIQPLRRVFSYPPALRALMYKNIIHMVHQAPLNTELRQVCYALGSVLLTHVRRFIDVEKPPYLLLDHCVKESAGGILQEPLGDLIWCLAVIESRRAPSRYYNSHIIDLSKKLASVSIQDFPVSKEPLESPADDPDDPDGAHATAIANRNQVRVLGSVIEALIHAALIVPKERFTWRLVVDVIAPLLILKGKVFELLRSAGLASAGDTFRDLGGDLELERLRPGARLIFQRASKGSSGGKKGGPRKKKGGSEPAAGANGLQNTDHRFGVFSILTSAHMKPALSLTAALEILEMMTEAMNDESQDDNNPFIGQEKSDDFNELRSYLLSVAHKHVDDFIQTWNRWTLEEPEVSRVDQREMAVAVETLVRMAMSDFKRFRRASGDAGHGGLRALQITESCASALPLLCQADDEIIILFCKAILPGEAHSVFSAGDEGTCETATTALEKLVENLLNESMNKEAMTVVKIHGHLVQSILTVKEEVEKKAKFLDKRSEWTLEIIASSAIGESSIIKNMMRTCLTYFENNNDLRRGEEICVRLLDVIGGCGNDEEPPENREGDPRKLVSALAVQQETCLAVVDAVCDMIERGLNDVEWCLGRMSCLELAADTQFSSDAEATEVDAEEGSNLEVEKQLLEKTVKLAIRAEDAAQTRLTGVLKVLLGLLRCAIAKWLHQERLLKFVSRTYKLLSMATQAQVKRRGDPRSSFVDLINEGKSLAPVLAKSYMFIDESGIEGSGSNAAKAKSEGRIKAQVVYDEEKFHQQLISAQKKCKVNLLRGMRRNTARDFRIREDMLNDEDEGDNDGENGEDANGEENGDAGRAPKRRKMSTGPR